MVIDADGADPVVITGSMNWTGSGDHRNDENTLIIHRADVAQAYRDNFLRLFNALGPETLCTRTRVFLPLVVNGTNGSVVMP